jgi:outer membrane protein OmpA-like peptidoglycan-associated protein
MGLMLLGGCAASPFADRADLVAPSTACASRTFDVYFAESAATLTQPARQAIDLMARQMAGCQITHVTVIGLASATGTPETNLSLSQRRAQTVAQAFEAKGWPMATIVRGRVVMRDDELIGTAHGRPVRFMETLSAG